MTDKPKTRRPGAGFASLTPEQRREVSAKGGASVPPEKRPFAADKALASEAGKKGHARMMAVLAKKVVPDAAG